MCLQASENIAMMLYDLVRNIVAVAAVVVVVVVIRRPLTLARNVASIFINLHSLLDPRLPLPNQPTPHLRPKPNQCVSATTAPTQAATTQQPGQLDCPLTYASAQQPSKPPPQRSVQHLAQVLGERK
jgi:hypothetical protein